MKHLVTLLVLIALPARAVSVPGAGVVALLTHADSGRGLAKPELVRRMAHRTRARRRLLSQEHEHPVRAGVRADLGAGGGIVTNEYLVHLAVGTPPRPVALTLDTGSDLVWTQCAPCLDCFDQGLPLLDPAGSSTYAALPCGAPRCRALPFTSCGGRSGGNRSCAYVYHYGDKSLTVGQLATDRFTFGPGDNPDSLSTRRLTFGCGHFNKGVFQANETGIAGFGRGRWSLPSQLNVTSFSYCFTSMFESKSSLVTLGAPAELYSHAHSGEVRTTPLIKNPSQPSLYFLSLKGISVGSTRLPVPESRFRSTIIDSGASITTLPEDVYEAVKAEFVAQVGLPLRGVEGSALDLCFALPVTAFWRRPAVPALTLHLEGADWELPRANYVFKDYGARVMCVVLDAAPGEQTVIGNFQQQNTHVVYDLQNDLLSFAPARCDRLVASL
ncbi:aspartic proteinase nepenthesin-1-like [Phragmites australis]|uniref:aspartic proteinase nepenthesin-1-like n=1 Tax=Phragmites australis TaxID=29695 RepID=UPI002D782A3E|nr:aspartic proteinase nepenthesin-1-like [Phragmites australis]